MSDDTPTALGALQIDEGKLRGHVDEVVRSSVEETLNGLLDAEADEICRAQRYERSPERVDGRAGHYERKLETKAGQVKLAATPAVRNRHHRAVHTPGGLRGGSPRGDVSGGSVSAQSGRHHRSLVGYSSELGHSLTAQSKDLPPH